MTKGTRDKPRNQPCPHCGWLYAALSACGLKWLCMRCFRAFEVAGQ